MAIVVAPFVPNAERHHAAGWIRARYGADPPVRSHAVPGKHSGEGQAPFARCARLHVSDCSSRHAALCDGCVYRWRRRRSDEAPDRHVAGPDEGPHRLVPHQRRLLLSSDTGEWHVVERDGQVVEAEWVGEGEPGGDRAVDIAVGRAGYGAHGGQQVEFSRRDRHRVRAVCRPVIEDANDDEFGFTVTEFVVEDDRLTTPATQRAVAEFTLTGRSPCLRDARARDHVDLQSRSTGIGCTRTRSAGGTILPPCHDAPSPCHPLDGM